MELSAIKGIGEKTAKKLSALGINDVEGLIDFLPSDYLDFGREKNFDELTEGGYALVKGKIVKVSGVMFLRGRKFFRARAELCGGKIDLIWFNALYLRSNIEEGEEYLLWGKLSRSKSGALLFANPKFERASAAKRLKGIMPVYRTKGLIPQAAFQKFVAQAIEIGSIKSVIPDYFGEMPIEEAYKAAHFPQGDGDAERAAGRLALERATAQIAALRLADENKNAARVGKYRDANLAPLESAFGFDFTASQKSAVDVVKKGFFSDKPFKGILTGDVGSGKTAVAFAAMYIAVKSGFQCAMMAPTEILAAQHFENAERILTPLGVSCAFVASSTNAGQKRETASAVAAGKVSVLFGTHAILSDNYQFKNLSFIVIDEQQKFGVRQRGVLESKGRCDLLILSATPIPRSVMMTYYGGITPIYLEPREGMKKVGTFVLGDAKLAGLWDFVGERLKAGERAFIVCPKIEDSEGVAAESAERLFEEVSERFGAEAALLHGRMSAEKKRETMRAFASGEKKALVSTTVVETGVDVADATVMVVMNAERFGLATLHQLRGRVGRGGKPSYCFLHTSKRDCERLAVMRECGDGRQIAERDLELRGCGELFGFAQSGSGFNVSVNTLKRAREICDKLFERGEVPKESLKELSNKLNFIAMD